MADIFKCTCGVEHTSVPGWIPKARLDEASEQIKAARKELLDASPKIAGYAEAVEKAAKLEGEITGIRESATRSTALAQHGIRPEGMRFASVAYEDAIEAEADATKRPSFADWLAAAGKEHAAVKAFAGPGAPKAPGAPAAPPPKVDAGAGAPPATPPGRMTTAQIQEALTAARSLPSAERKKKIDEIEAAAKASAKAPGT